MKVVLDSNILLVAIGRRSSYRPIWDAFIEGKYQLVISEDIVHEYEEILNQHSAPGIADYVKEIFVESPDVIIQQIYYRWGAIYKDPDDDKFFDVSVAANVDYLVTNDAHFQFPSVNIITGNEFLDIITDL
jgi:putative PIN family toxin of toxin-antitoxin system